jgi:dTDP-4-dehydrorhamnose 3,5-epimerase
VLVTESDLPGVLLIEVRAFPDDRGYFAETFNAQSYASHGIDAEFVQDNISYSRTGTLRGMHFQHPHGQAKLVSVLSGEVYDVCVDVRLGSPNFGRWFGITLSAENRRQLFIPKGFAHGFLVTGKHALVLYKVSAYYEPSAERAIAWNDPALGIEWPATDPLLSVKDAEAPPLADVVASGGAPNFSES